MTSIEYNNFRKNNVCVILVASEAIIQSKVKYVDFVFVLFPCLYGPKVPHLLAKCNGGVYNNDYLVVDSLQVKEREREIGNTGAREQCLSNPSSIPPQ